MNDIMSTPPSPPHRLYNPRLSPSRPVTFPITNTSFSHRKRKAEDEEPASEDRMSASPSNSPRLSSHSLPAHRHIKRPRADVVGRPLALPRLLETLDTDSLRGVLQSICTRHPSIGTEVENTAPKPSVASALGVLKKYESTLQSSFPYGDDMTSDYAYNRVRQALRNLLDALADFTPHFLPPHETQASQALAFLDGATEIIHRLPEWSSYQNNLHKQTAYEEMSQAWIAAMREAAKRAGGMQLQYGGWDQKIIKHNQQARGKLQGPVDELQAHIGWMGGQPPVNFLSSAQARNYHSRGGGGGAGGGGSGEGGGGGGGGGSPDDDIASVRQELLAGTYGSQFPVRVGPW